MEPEVWRPAVGFDGLYTVSNLGRVTRIQTTARGRCGKPRTLPTALMAQHRTHHGYCWITLSRAATNGVRHKVKKHVHVLVAEAFLGVQDSDVMQVNHIDGDKTNNLLSNLEWVTPKQNAQHAIRLGLRPPGDRFFGRSRSPLTEGDVISMRARYAQGVRQSQLAVEFGIASSCVSEIVREITWRMST